MLKEGDGQILELLLAQHYITEDDVKNARLVAKTGRGTVLDFLFTEDLISQDMIGQAVAESLKVPYADLNSNMPSSEKVKRIPSSVGIKYRVVFFKEDGKKIIVATDHPEKKGILTALKSSFKGKKVTVAYSLSDDIDHALLGYRKSFNARFLEIVKKGERVAPEIVQEILNDAITMYASDIHLEPRENNVEIRFRIDGVLHYLGTIDSKIYDRILNRIKVLARLRTDERSAPQDGSIRYESKLGIADIRVSVMPVFDGEKIVMRLLANYTRGLSLHDLGLLSKDQEVVTKVAKRPFGMILVVGPTGSGKTTTLYGLIKILNMPEVNIATIEDPIEYRVTGVNHMQVNAERGLTFARGLRSIVRQDPDIILVGEIRDTETAEVSVNAALTGHLLLSTFHANDAATAIPRLLDMGVERFLLSSTVELIIAQRLVRKICESCRYSVTKDVSEVVSEYPEVKKYFGTGKVTLYNGKGCGACNDTGYSGRTAAFEIITIDPEMRTLIMQNPTAQAIWLKASANGATSMYEDGIAKVLSGVTTLQELRRVVTPTVDLYGRNKKPEKEANAKVKSSGKARAKAGAGTESIESESAAVTSRGQNGGGGSKTKAKTKKKAKVQPKAKAEGRAKAKRNR